MEVLTTTARKKPGWIRPALVTVLLVIAGFSQPIAIGFAIVVGAPVVLLIVLLTSGRRPTAWSQMD